jgi:hypothetical protein
MFDEAGHLAVNPTRAQVGEFVGALGDGNGFVVLERLNKSGLPTDEFAQSAIPRDGTTAWVLEYRSGSQQFRAFTEDPNLVVETLGEYANEGPTWRDRLQWTMFLTHGRNA